MKGLIPSLYLRSLEDMDSHELCDALNITPEDLKERFSDRITELGVESNPSQLEFDFDDEEEEDSYDDWNLETDWDEDDDFLDDLDDSDE